MATEQIGVFGSLSTDLGPLRSGEDGLGGGELFEGHEGIVGWLLGPDPVGSVVPSHLGLVAERDVLDIEELFVTLLAIPDLEAGVAGFWRMARTAILLQTPWLEAR